MPASAIAPRYLTIDSAVLDRVNRALDAIRAGKMIILVDDEDRENEGDLTMAADRVSAEAITFMATHGRGLICVALDEEQVGRLDLPMMTVPGRGGPALGTAFTVSIEAATGVTTGISAADRARTIQVATDPESKPNDVVTPGHVFPLKARPGGVLVRTGQTEGSVDLARLAGCRPAGVICEIMKDDGTMARMPDLEQFAEEWFDYSERRMVSALEQLPSGRVQGRSVHDALPGVVERRVPRADGWRARSLYY